LKRYKKVQTDDFAQVSQISRIYDHLDQPLLSSKFEKCAMDFFNLILPDDHPEIKQLTNQ
jgi:hypothetical protein